MHMSMVRRRQRGFGAVSRRVSKMRLGAVSDMLDTGADIIRRPMKGGSIFTPAPGSGLTTIKASPPAVIVPTKAPSSDPSAVADSMRSPSFIPLNYFDTGPTISTSSVDDGRMVPTTAVNTNPGMSTAMKVALALGAAALLF